MDNWLDVDSYKYSHIEAWPRGMTKGWWSIVPRWCNNPLIEDVVFYGLQAWLIDNLPQRECTAEADSLIAQAHGMPFPLSKFEGLEHSNLPLDIYALPEGTVVPIGTPLVRVESCDPRNAWIGGFIETSLLRGVWYPTTLATVAHAARGLFKGYYERTCDTLDGLDFAMHDASARGASSLQSSQIASGAYMTAFKSTDTIAALPWLKRNYGPLKECPGYNIPAIEHSVIMSYGKLGEADAIAGFLKLHSGNIMIAVVVDTYDWMNCIPEIICVALKETIIASNVQVVIRLDSGDPLVVLPVALTLLERTFGSKLNSKGYKALNCVKVLHSDGIKLDRIAPICEAVTKAGYSMDSVGLMIGGGFAQDWDRDTLGFAYKINQARVADEFRQCIKRPANNPAKNSMPGIVSAGLYDGNWSALDLNNVKHRSRDQMVKIVENGKLVKTHTHQEIRDRANRY
jgi:nicotinamide phosphoribosyltransferase